MAVVSAQTPVLQVVWFKRDLRWLDHAPLVNAAASGPVLMLWIDEPQMWAQADASQRHRDFALGCVASLAAWVAEQGSHLCTPCGDAIDVLADLKAVFGSFVMHSFEETGNAWSYERDLVVASWCRANRIIWHESPCNGVVRRLSSRDRWSQHWANRMSHAPLGVPLALLWAAIPKNLSHWVCNRQTQPQTATGATEAHALLDSFLMVRGQNYRAEMSSPLTAADSCSRLSPHLAWGTISVRECVHAVWVRRTALLKQPAEQRPAGFLESIKSFESRLHWHCHFIQKLESEPEIEWRNVHRGFDGIRNEGDPCETEAQLLAAWCAGQTGYPFVDACMRSLNATGWINFRMRAMLMSFASYQLWLHWRQSGLHLARQFIDYEPGIHWSQCQMQSGVTGINTVRIYNPIKQGIDQDPHGSFVRQWVPELAYLTNETIHTPWLCEVLPPNYPMPVVDLKLATQAAKDAIYTQKAKPKVKADAQAVYEKHGSRNPSRDRPAKAIRPKTRAAPQTGSAQMSLLF